MSSQSPIAEYLTPYTCSYILPYAPNNNGSVVHVNDENVAAIVLQWVMRPELVEFGE